MKRSNLWKYVCLLLLFSLTLPTQAQSLKDLFGSLKEGVKEGVDKVVNKVTVNDSTIVGTWHYVKPSCKFKSDNLLAQAGGAVASTKVESELASACKKLKITNSNTTFTFKSDKTYTQTIAGKSTSGTYTFDRDKMTVVMTGTLGFSTTAHVKFQKDKMTLVYDADRVWELGKSLANVAGKFMNSNMLTIFNSVSDSYEGMQLGFELQK